MTEEERRAQRARIAAIERQYNQTHLRNLAQYQAEVTRIFEDVVKEAARLGINLDSPEGRMLSFNDLPAVRHRVNAMLKAMRQRLEAAVVNGINAEWALANGKNDAVVEQIAAAGLTKGDTKAYFNNHAAALKAFKARKTAGMSLSRRVWNLTQQYKSELEMALDCSIRDGLSAQEMARQLKQYLNYPDKLFRRVRDKHGVLQPSKAAAAFHPGRGVYRSSHKNALRLASTETNIAYRTADHERIQALDFVLGIKIVLSNNHTIRNSKGQRVPLTDICDELAGNYPKGFKFTGWHPNCRCHTETILLSGADFEDFLKAKREDRAYDITKARGYVAEPPAAFQAWVKGNAGRIAAAAKAGTTPYFIKDNQKTVDALLSQKATPAPATAKEPTGLDTLAKRLGIEAGEPMEHEKANTMKPNPHFSEDKQYRINCQSTVVAYELRRRGLDVEAFGNPGSLDYTPGWLAQNTRVAWTTGEGKIPDLIKSERVLKHWIVDKQQRTRYIYSNVSEVWDEFAGKTQAPGRYHVSWGWKNSNKGHIITMEVGKDGRRSFYDPQTGKNSKAINDWIKDGRKCLVDLDKGFWGYRVDTLHPNNDVIEGVVKKVGSKAATPEVSLNVERIFIKAKYGADGAQAGAVSKVSKKVINDPYSPEIEKEMAKFRKEAKKQNVLKQIMNNDKSELSYVASNGHKTITHPGHKKDNWNNTLEMAKRVNEAGADVAFLPEYEEKSCADAVTKIAGKYRIVDFKQSTTTSWNTLQADLKKGFTQAEAVVVKLERMRAEGFIKAIEYMKRSGIKIGDLKVINRAGQILDLTVNDMSSEEWYKKKIRKLLK